MQRTHPPKRRPATSPHPRGPRHPAARDGFPSHFQAATPRPSSRSAPAPAPFSLLRAFAGSSWLPPSSPGVHRPCSRSILHVHPLNESETDLASSGEIGKQGKHNRKAVQLLKKNWMMTLSPERLGTTTAPTRWRSSGASRRHLPERVPEANEDACIETSRGCAPSEQGDALPPAFAQYRYRTDEPGRPT